MTAVSRAAERTHAASHIRPFAMHRDLSALATLIELSFGSELAMTGGQMVRDMRRAALWGPLLWAPGALSFPFAGYVWIEDGRLLGNVSLSQDERRPRVWTLSNVAVHPEYRGRGIASALVDRALDHVRERRGRRVLLQVRSGNERAIGLYRRRGFVHYDTVREFELGRHSWPVVIGAAERPLRGVRSRDGASLYALACVSTSAKVLRRCPLKAEDYRRGLLWWVRQRIRELFSGSRRLELVAEDDGEVVAHGWLTLYDQPGRAHELELRVAPAQRGRWEALLVEGLLFRAERVSWRAVRAAVSTTHPEAMEALERLGFRSLRLLDQMAVEIGVETASPESRNDCARGGRA